jgi:hypothetical protein
MRLLTYSIPLVIFAIIATASIKTLINLYYDTRKITVFDVAESGYGISKHFGKKAYSIVLDKFQQDAFGLLRPQTVQAEGIIVPLKIEDTFVLDEVKSPLVKKNLDNFGVEHLPEPEKEATTSNEPLLKNAQNEREVTTFLEKNGALSDFIIRERLAVFFGIEAYTGTERQNNMLRRKLGEFTGSQLEGLVTKQ